MSKKLVIASVPVQAQDCLATVLFDGQKAVEFSICPEQKHSILGSIYVGQIEKIQENINAAFVRIQPHMNGYLSLDDCSHAILKTRKKTEQLKAGDELLVQVDKEALKQKLPRLTTNLTVSGKYLVLSTGRRSLNFSRKLNAEDKKQLKRLLSEVYDGNFGVVVRTNAPEASEEELKTEYKDLREQLDRICRYGISRSCCSCLLQSTGEWIGALKQYSFHSLSEVITDHAGVYAEVESYLKKTGSEDQVRLTLYQDPLLPLRNLYSLNSLMNSLKNQTVWLKSGGFLVIQQTEAFVVIDVNTGKYSGSKTTEESFRRINREAAEEIAVQIRLRQLSGIILVDFINMEQPLYQKELMEYLQALVREDPVKTKVVDITRLHIVEMTRQKEKKSFTEQLLAVAGKERTSDEL